MSKGFRFLEFNVYKDSKKFYRKIVSITSSFDREHLALREQMRRSALSIILNIAEGSAKKSDKDFNRYIKNSLGSVNETVAGLDIAYESGQVDKVDFEKAVTLALAIANQLGGFSKSLM